jgi:hypothetical protein
MNYYILNIIYIMDILLVLLSLLILIIIYDMFIKKKTEYFITKINSSNKNNEKINMQEILVEIDNQINANPNTVMNTNLNLLKLKKYKKYRNSLFTEFNPAKRIIQNISAEKSYKDIILSVMHD